jgi:hypothetical protein
MSKKQFEENLNYGDCNNIICVFGGVFEKIVWEIEKHLTKS